MQLFLLMSIIYVISINYDYLRNKGVTPAERFIHCASYEVSNPRKKYYSILLTLGKEE